jgi:hypothetical protein
MMDRATIPDFLQHRAARACKAVAAAGVLLALPAAAIGPASAMTFTLQQVDAPKCRPNCPSVVVASGEIQLNDYRRLAELLIQSQGNRKVAPLLMISSPGGQSGGGLALGQLVRRLGVTVVVGRPVGEQKYAAGYCNSACTFVLMGGKKRIVPEGSRVGIHWYRDAPRMLDIVTGGELGSPSNPDEFDRIIRSYARSMGVDQNIVAHMRRIPHDNIHILSRQELMRYRLATSK